MTRLTLTRPALAVAASAGLVAALALLAAACGGSEKRAATTAPAGTTAATTTAPAATTAAATTAPATRSVVLPRALVRFDASPPAPVAAPSGTYPGPATPTSLDGVRFVDQFADELAKPGVRATLERQGFVVVPTDQRLLTDAYASESYLPWPVYVTTDAATNQLHLAFDKVLRSLEQGVLLPKLETLVGGLVTATQQQLEAARSSGAGDAVVDAADRAAQLVQVAAAELGLPVELGPLARDEKALVDAHAGSDPSPVTGSRTDWSLFTPRGHYTRTPALRRYFVAMSVLGQAAFCLPGSRGCDGAGPARIGVLAARALTRDPALVELWKQVYEPTAFLVGVADDYTPLDVAEAAGALDDLAALADDGAVEQIARDLTAARPVRIDAERPAIRLMGTRFVVDSFVLDLLLSPNVGTEAKPRLLGSSLDLAAALGSDTALAALEAAGKTDYAGYHEMLDALRDALAARPQEEWNGTVYDAWLHALVPLFTPHGDEYPDLMRSAAWAAKALQSGLGSYAELKHDTLLYTKQALAEGGGDEPPGPRRNWVEPEPLVFARLAAATTMIRDGLAQRGLLSPANRELLAADIDLFSFLARIAGDELKGTPIAKDDNDRLTFVGGLLDSLFWRTADQSGYSAVMDRDGAIVADIESGPDAVLEIGTGRVGRLLVLVPDDAGRFQLAAGGVYSFYEFESPPGERLTDEEWRTRLDAGTAPPQPPWTDVLRPSAG